MNEDAKTLIEIDSRDITEIFNNMLDYSWTDVHRLYNSNNYFYIDNGDFLNLIDVYNTIFSLKLNSISAINYFKDKNCVLAATNNHACSTRKSLFNFKIRNDIEISEAIRKLGNTYYMSLYDLYSVNPHYKYASIVINRNYIAAIFDKEFMNKYSKLIIKLLVKRSIFDLRSNRVLNYVYTIMNLGYDIELVDYIKEDVSIINNRSTDYLKLNDNLDSIQKLLILTTKLCNNKRILKL